MCVTEIGKETSNTRRWWIPSKSHILRFGPSIICEIGWWIFALTDPGLHLSRFTRDTPFIGKFYYMSVTMVLGSLVAGLTSEGGGAVAFPVMTLALGVPPPVARDFSFAIQSFGMTCAAITIFGLGVPVDKEALLWGSLGGGVGLAFGLAAVAPYLPPAYAKMLFVSVWASFAVALYRLNKTKDRKVFDCALDADSNLVLIKSERKQRQQDERKQHMQEEGAVIPDSKETKEDGELTRRSKTDKDDSIPVIVSNPQSSFVMSTSTDLNSKYALSTNWRLFLIFTMGTFGGICSSVAGSGIDMASFSILTLYFRVSEKVATPTSVILMAINAVFGITFRLLGLGGEPIHGAVWDFLAVCVPIVVCGAPLGATIASYLQRLTISKVLYFLDALQFVAALAIIKPWSKPFPNNVGLCVSSAGTLVLGSLFFHVIARYGDERGSAIAAAARVKKVPIK